MAMYYNGKKVRNLYYNGKCITRLALGKEMTRLVEGDDFVRAEWLKGDGTAYIDTNILLNDTSILWNFNVRRAVTDNSNNVFFWIRNGAGSNEDFQASMFILNFGGNTRIANFSDGRTNADTIIPVDLSISEYSVECTDTKFIINGTEYTRTVISEIPYSNKSLKLFKVDIEIISVTSTTQCDCEYFNVTKNGVPLLQLIPCRLLRPIPAALDGNGIARNAEECGMYDAVSGKFFGNVGSGSFTVSDN